MKGWFGALLLGGAIFGSAMWKMHTPEPEPPVVTVTQQQVDRLLRQEYCGEPWRIEICLVDD